MINKDTLKHVIALLPIDNNEVSIVNNNHIQSICTALEIEYRMCEEEKKIVKDHKINELKNVIKDAIE